MVAIIDRHTRRQQVRAVGVSLFANDSGHPHAPELAMTYREWAPAPGPEVRSSGKAAALQPREATKIEKRRAFVEEFVALRKRAIADGMPTMTWGQILEEARLDRDED